MGFAAGARAIPRAIRMLRAERVLWPWAALPAAVNVIAFGLAATVFYTFALDPLTASLQESLSVAEPEVWYAWLWLGPLKLLAWMARGLVITLFAVLLFASFFVLGGVIASPFLDVLSQHVERIHLGRDPENATAPAEGIGLAMRSALWSMGQEARRAAFLVAGQLGFFALALVPGLQPIAAVGAFVFGALFLSLDYTGYSFDRRTIPFRQRRQWVWDQRAGVLGFGGAAFATLLVPGLNFLSLPVFVTAGTLIALEWPPETPPG